ncbi:MAG: hypothetical protein NUV67_05540, partial [archaeon]|nr:hypothetical protein [archaeon]
RAFFRAGQFGQYKHELEGQILRDSGASKFFTEEEVGGFFSGLKTPSFVDYSFIPGVGRRLLENGYSPSELTMRQLHANGLNNGATIAEVHSFLAKMEKELANKVFFLFFKPIAARKNPGMKKQPQ